MVSATEFIQKVPQPLLEADGFDLPFSLLEGPTLELTWERYFGVPCVSPPLAATELLEELTLGPDHYALLRRHPEAEIQATTVRYVYSLAVLQQGVRQPRFWLTSELNLSVPEQGSCFLCAFDQGAHYNWGGEDRWAEQEAFREEALARARARLARGSFARTGATVIRPDGALSVEPDDAPDPPPPPEAPPAAPPPAAPPKPAKRGPARSRRRLDEALRPSRVPARLISGLLLLGGLVCGGLAYFVHPGFALLACFLVFAASAASQ